MGASEDGRATSIHALHCGGDVQDWAVFDPLDERAGTGIYNPYFVFVVRHPSGTVLFDSGSDDQGGALVVYPDRMTEPLSCLRAAPNDGAVAVSMNAGDTIVMYGGLLPHRIRRTATGQARIVSVLCFRPADE